MKRYDGGADGGHRYRVPPPPKPGPTPIERRVLLALAKGPLRPGKLAERVRACPPALPAMLRAGLIVQVVRAGHYAIPEHLALIEP